MTQIEDGVQGLRIAVPTNHFFEEIDDEVRAAVEDAVEVYRKLGAEIVEIEVPGIDNGLPSERCWDASRQRPITPPGCTSGPKITGRKREIGLCRVSTIRARVISRR